MAMSHPTEVRPLMVDVQEAQLAELRSRRAEACEKISRAFVEGQPVRGLHTRSLCIG